MLFALIIGFPIFPVNICDVFKFFSVFYTKKAIISKNNRFVFCTLCPYTFLSRLSVLLNVRCFFHILTVPLTDDLHDRLPVIGQMSDHCTSGPYRIPGKNRFRNGSVATDCFISQKSVCNIRKGKHCCMNHRKKKLHYLIFATFSNKSMKFNILFMWLCPPRYNSSVSSQSFFS